MSRKGKSLHDPNVVFNELRMEKTFCDAVIRVDAVEFHIHKIVLCNSSTYFRALFERWSESDRAVFDIRGLSADMMQLIIEFAYTGCIPVAEDYVKDLLLAADQFIVPEIVQTCHSFLHKHLTPENCIGIWWFTKAFDTSELHQSAYRHILDHFEDVILGHEYLQLSLQELTEILASDELIVKVEKTVFEAILLWIYHLPAERAAHIVMLLSKVRLALTSEEYIRDYVLPNELVRNNPECLSIATAAKLSLICIKNNGQTRGYCPFSRPRLPSHIVLSIGGWVNNNPSMVIEAYDDRADNWVLLPDILEHPRAYIDVVFLKGYVYCVGGFDRVHYFNTVYRLDVSTHVWQEVAPMHDCRCYVSVTSLNECIYAFGGHNGSTRLRSAEFYKPETNQWTFIAPMHEARSDAGCTTFKDKIYICGGFNGEQFLQTAEYYTPQTNMWTMITPMLSVRSGLAVATYADHVFAVGGYDGVIRLNTVEAYNPTTNLWHEVTPMLLPRSNFGIEVANSRLFVVGGFNGNTISCDAEYYDFTANAWFMLSKMSVSRSGLSCCAVPRHPYFTMATFPRDNLPITPEEDRINL